MFSNLMGACEGNKIIEAKRLLDLGINPNESDSVRTLE